MPSLDGLRGRHLFALDLVIVFAAIVGAMILRFDSFRLDRSVFLYFPAALLPLVVRPPVNILAGLYSQAWAYASVGELVRILGAVVAGTILIVSVFYLALVPFGVGGVVTEAGRFPRSFFVLEAGLSLVGYGGIRFLVRASTEWQAPFRRVRTAGIMRVPTLVYGAGEMGSGVLRTITQASDGLGMRVVGLLDDNPRKKNQMLRGARVLGALPDLEGVARTTGARRLLIAIPSANGDVIRRAVSMATELGLETRTSPSLDDLVSGRMTAAAIRQVKVEDLLRREPVVIDEVGLRGMIAGSSVLVTGAGGSIGSELARQVFDLGPARLILLDRAEGPLYDIERELHSRARRDRGTLSREIREPPELVTRLANVASLPTMQRIVAEDRPLLILHAAAYKHVPMMEEHPADAVYTNVGGTLVALSAALEAGVPRFVLVSTDKAVEPSSVMGATKRLAEIAVAETARKANVAYVAVRFGNVLASSGSVVPLFQRQLEEGVPLTVTDPDATRFFMTIPEAARLILQAALIGEAGDLFVLDMGEPIKILDLARDLARLAGRDPDSVPIDWIGLRPGEKKHESLSYTAEEVVQTSHPKVLRVRPQAHVRENVNSELQALVEIAAAGDHAAAKAALRRALDKFDVATTLAA
jgi:FlaA1/EpsC-like NDP-sugar epimerase